MKCLKFSYLILFLIQVFRVAPTWGFEKIEFFRVAPTWGFAKIEFFEFLPIAN